MKMNNEEYKKAIIKIILFIFGLFFLVIIFNSIVEIIPPGYVGVVYDARQGILFDRIMYPGWNFKIPILQQVYKVKTARDTINMYELSYDECRKDPECDDVAVQVPSKEGLLITIDISTLYKTDPAKAPNIIQTLTPEYRTKTIIPYIRSVAREVTGNMAITELYGAGRERLQEGILEKMKPLMEKDGFILDGILVRDVSYPEQIRRAIEEKQAMEQQALKKQYEIDVAKKEAERKKIEGEGVANQKIAIAEGDAKALELVAKAIKENPEVLKFKNLEVMSKLYENPNTKFIALPSDQMILPLDLGFGDDKDKR